MKRIHIAHTNPEVILRIQEVALSIATAFASHGMKLVPELETKQTEASPAKWRLYPFENDWWALVQHNSDKCTILIRHRYRREMAEALMQAICHKYPHECTFAE